MNRYRDLCGRCGNQFTTGQLCDDCTDASTLRAAAAVFRRRVSRQTFMVRVLTRVLELRADRIEASP